MDKITLEAIIRANKLGATGIRVTGYLEPQSPIQDPRWLLVTQLPEPQSATGLAWYDD